MSDTTPAVAGTRVLVLGAGAAGLVAARDLVTAGHEVTVVDKGRAVGGRLASRRVHGAVFDHGAQFLTIKHDDVRDLLRPLEQQGVLTTWFHGAPDLPPPGDPAASTLPSGDGHPRYRGHPTMRAIAEHLAAGLPDVRTGLRITELRTDPGGWVATARPVDGGDEVHLTATALLCTAPLPQSLALLDEGGVTLGDDTEARLRPVTYDPTIAVMAVPDGPTALPNAGALRLSEGPVSWIGDGLRKGSSPSPAIVVHASADLSRDRWTASDDELSTLLLEAARPHLGVAARAVRVQRWRYARPTSPVPAGDDLALLDHVPVPVAFAGDAFAGGRVEGALRSGRAAARLLAAALPPVS